MAHFSASMAAVWRERDKSLPATRDSTSVQAHIPRASMRLRHLAAFSNDLEDSYCKSGVVLYSSAALKYALPASCPNNRRYQCMVQLQEQTNKQTSLSQLERVSGLLVYFSCIFLLVGRVKPGPAI